MARECGHTEPLIEIGSRLLKSANLADHTDEAIAGFVLDAALPYYRSIWEQCSRRERLVLVHLAQEGLVNPKRRE